MKAILLLTLTLFVPNSFAETQIVNIDRTGICTVYSANWSKILHSIKIPFEFPNFATIEGAIGSKKTYNVSTGKLDITDLEIEMMDSKGNFITKPISINLNISESDKYRSLTGSIHLYDIFAKKQIKMGITSAVLPKVYLTETFHYFQKGTHSKIKLPKEKIQTLSVFCQFN